VGIIASILNNKHWPKFSQIPMWEGYVFLILTFSKEKLYSDQIHVLLGLNFYYSNPGYEASYLGSFWIFQFSQEECDLYFEWKK
jgi:hypothetical protein